MYDKTSEPSEQGYIFAPRAQTRGSLLPIPAAMLGGGYGDLKRHIPILSDRLNIKHSFSIGALLSEHSTPQKPTRIATPNETPATKEIFRMKSLFQS